MKRTLQIFIFLLAAGALFLLRLAPSLAMAADLREELLFSVVQIVSITEAGTVSNGSGTTISKDGYVLTNAHVVTDEKTKEPVPIIRLCYTISPYLLPRCGATAKIVAINTDYDVALLLPDKKIGRDGKPTKASFVSSWKKSGHEFFAVPFQNVSQSKLPAILDAITVWGYPGIGGTSITVTKGYVSGFYIEEKNDETLVKYIKTDSSVNPGNSGGAAFDQWFSFIGVPTRAYEGQLGFILPVATIVEWLQDLDRKKIINIRRMDSVSTAQFSFSDVNAADPLSKVASLLRHLKVIEPSPDGMLRADSVLSRAEALKLMMAAGNEGNLSAEASVGPINAYEFSELLQRAFPNQFVSKNVSRTQPVTRREALIRIYELLRP